MHPLLQSWTEPKLSMLVQKQQCFRSLPHTAQHPLSDRAPPIRSRPQLPTFVLRPFWWPMNMKEMPPMEASPHTMAGSSSPALSPCSSTNLQKLPTGSHPA